MRLPWSKAPVHQASCRDYATCSCTLDVDTIGKHVFIELSSACNLSCQFCAYSWSERPGKMMPLPLLEKILRDLKKLEPVEYIMFSALGEPTLHPQFEEACRMVRKSGYKLIVTTNGSRLRESMAQLPISELYVSFNTPTAEAYELKRGKGIGFEEYVENLARFLQAVPMFDTYIYFLTENRRDYPEARGLVQADDPHFARRLEDLLRRFKPGVFVPVPIPREIELFSNVRVIMKPFTLWANDNVPEHLELIEAESIPASSCSYYKHHLNIIASGEVTVCCGDYDAALSLGNVSTESLREIYLKKRPDLDLARNELCRKCKGRVVARGRTGSEASS